MKKKIFVFSIIILYIYMSIGCMNTKDRINRTIQNGNLIISSLSEYYSDNQTYPENINDLIPKYLSSIPRTRTNHFLFSKSIFVYESFYKPNSIYILKYYDNSDNLPYIYSSINRIFKIDNINMSQTDIKSKTARNNIEAIIKALEKYHEDNQEYPPKINNLVPNYIKDLSIFGVINTANTDSIPFKYSVQNDDSQYKNNQYEIFFKYGLFKGYIYKSIQNKWKYFTTLI